MSSSSAYSQELVTTRCQSSDGAALGGHATARNWEDSCTNEQPNTSSPTHGYPPQTPQTDFRSQSSTSRNHLTTSAKMLCFACNTLCSSPSSLSRHQREQCEREVRWICPQCNWAGERLARHYAKAHGDQCHRGCSKTQEKVCDACKQALSESFQSLPAKRAWGCPYCSTSPRCFDTIEGWTDHCLAHHSPNGRAPTWSYSNMIRSLLLQPLLANALPRYDWKKCDWSEVTEKTHPSIKEALERCKIPPEIGTHDQYRNLSTAEAVIRYVFYSVSTGQPLSTLLAVDLRAGNSLQHSDLRNATCAALADVDSMPGSTSTYEHRMPLAVGGKSFRQRTSSLIGRNQRYPKPGSADPLMASELVYKHAGFISPSGLDLATDISDHAMQLPAFMGSHVHLPMQTGTLASILPDVDSFYPRQRSRSGSNSDTRPHRPVLNRSFSNLSIRPSSSKSTTLLSEEVPPVPAIPQTRKSTDTGKAGTEPYYMEDWIESTYIEEDPTLPHQGRPMSGVIEAYLTTW